MRIVGGKYRGRILDGPVGKAVRPTTDRARESLFNILEHGEFAPGGLSPLRNAHVLDAYCGTGALGLEALSRGAAHATFIDDNATAMRLARANAKKLGESARAEFITADATKPPRGPTPCSIVFLDAPYGEGLTEPALKALAAAGWMAPDAVVIAEIGMREDLALPAGFAAADERRYGKAKLVFLRWSPA